MNRAEGLRMIRSAVADALGLRPEEVKPESRLVTDLGADSLDFVELIFVMEKKFGVALRQSELDFLSRAGLDAVATGKDTPLSVDTVAKLRRWLPAIDTLADAAGLTASQIYSLITPETLWLVVEEKLAHGA